MSTLQNKQELGFATRAVHVGNEVDKDSGAIIGKTEYLDQTAPSLR